MAMIILNILIDIIQTDSTIMLGWNGWFSKFDVFAAVIFSAEYGLRVWSCVSIEAYREGGPLWGRVRFCTTMLSLLDLANLIG